MGVGRDSEDRDGKWGGVAGEEYAMGGGWVMGMGMEIGMAMEM